MMDYVISMLILFFSPFWLFLEITSKRKPIEPVRTAPAPAPAPDSEEEKPLYDEAGIKKMMFYVHLMPSLKYHKDEGAFNSWCVATSGPLWLYMGNTRGPYTHSGIIVEAWVACDVDAARPLGGLAEELHGVKVLETGKFLKEGPWVDEFHKLMEKLKQECVQAVSDAATNRAKWEADREEKMKMAFNKAEESFNEPV